MTEDENSLIDSNILVYAYDKSESTKNAIAEKILEEIFTNERTSAVSTQNISEFYINVTKKIEKPISTTEAYHVIQEIMSMSNVKTLTTQKQTILKAISISTNYNIHYWDALIVAVMQENDINTIITENEKDFQKVPSLTVINPFL